MKKTQEGDKYGKRNPTKKEKEEDENDEDEEQLKL